MSIDRRGLAFAPVLIVATPAVLFPEYLDRGIAGGVVVLASSALMAVAVWWLRDFGKIQSLTLALGVLALVGWAHAPNAGQQALLAGALVGEAGDLSLSATQHLGGIAFGLFAMAAIANFGRTRVLLTTAAGLVALAGGAILVAGFMGTPAFQLTTHAKFFRFAFADAIPRISLALPGVAVDGVNPNALAATALLVAPVAIVVATLPHSPTIMMAGLRVGGIISASSCIAILALTQSTSAWLTAAVMLVALALTGWRARLLVGMVVIALIIASQVQIDRSQMDPIPSLFRILGSRSVASRFVIWEPAWDLLAASPWLGIGLNQFHAIGDPPAFQAHAHNIFLQTALDIGLVGLAVYVALIGQLMVKAGRIAMRRSHASSIAVAGACALGGAHLFGVFDAIALGARVGLFQWLACGLILAACRVEAQSGDVGGLTR